MKIAVWHNLPSGGGRRALQYHLRGLTARGHEIKVWRPPIPDAAFAPFDGVEAERELPLASLPDHRSLVNSFRYGRRSVFNVRAMNAHCELCAQEIEKESWDVLFTNTCRIFGAPFMGRYTSLPKLLYLQEPHRPLYEPMPKLAWIDLPEEQKGDWSPRGIRRRLRDRSDLASARLRGREELLNAQSHSRILVNSRFSREAVLRAYGLDSRVCYLGVDTALFRDLSLNRESFIVGLGTIAASKNIETAIRSVAAVRESRPPLHWVGNMSDPAYAAEMKTLAEKLGVEFKTTVMATDQELVEILNRASMMIYTPRLEPFGLAPLEANACGCPVVAVAEGGVRETVEHGRNGYLTINDPDCLAAEITRLLEDPALAKRIGQQGRELVLDSWNLESSVDRIEAELVSVSCSR